MIHRNATAQIMRDLLHFPVVAIIGPRQVGKTTLARSLETQIRKPLLYLDLESENDLRKLASAETFLADNIGKCVILDEIQIMPRLFPLLRSLVDRQREPARFILLGSASPAILRDSSESLAGRIAYHELTPFSLPEVSPLCTMREHWMRGGFPEAFLSTDYEAACRWLGHFTTTFVERDLSRVLGWEVQAPVMLRFIRMLAHLHGKILNISDLSNSLDTSKQTVNKYLRLLEGSFLAAQLEPYFVNIGKRLTKSPKFYFRDSGFFHALARFRSLDDLLGSPYVGASWEAYVIEQIRRTGGREWEYYYYRTQQGAEADLLLITPRDKIAVVEIKYSNAPAISKGFYISAADVKADFRFVITPESDAFNTAEGVRICGLLAFLTEEMVRMAV